MDYDSQIKKAIATGTSDYIVWYTGSREQAEYVVYYSKYLKNNSLLLPLPDRAVKGHSTAISKELLEYFFLDFPDVIITHKNKGNGLPIVGIEILEQKPVGWNHTQRFPRAAASAILGVPFAYLMPQKRYMFDKVKTAKTEAKTYIIAGELYKENLREEYQLPYSLYKLSKIHNVPCLPFIWPLNEKNKFLCEGLEYNNDPGLRWKSLPPGPINDRGQFNSEIINFFNFIDKCIEYKNNELSNRMLMHEAIVKESIKKISPATTKLYKEKHIMLKDPYGGNLKTARVVNTIDYLKILKNTNSHYVADLVDLHYFKLFKQREKTVLIEISSDPTKGNRGFADPYSGVCASFDYRYCREIRNSPALNDRDYNLVFAPSNANSSAFFCKIIGLQIGKNTRLNLAERQVPEDTIMITEELFNKGPFKLKKELKNIFYFCDLIVANDNLFVGKSFIDK